MYDYSQFKKKVGKTPSAQYIHFSARNAAKITRAARRNKQVKHLKVESKKIESD